MNINQILSDVVAVVWGTPLLVFLLVANIILLSFSKLIPIRGLVHAISLVSGKHANKNAQGQITHFQALSNALAATIGLGNIAGVAVAIYQGGPGAVFWMWISALLGMNTKFFECTLAVMFRGKDYQGEVQGGPMYYIEKGMGEKYKFFAFAFALFGLIGTLALFQINQLASFLETSYSVDTTYTGMIFAVLTVYILLGGLKRISMVTSRVVPAMSLIYVVLCLVILGVNAEKVIPMFVSIFESAFGIGQVAGGVSGYAIMHVIQTGVKRAAFSNEAGIGTAPMAHGNAQTDEPISEGYVAMLGPLIDTIIVCTLTALAILVGIDSVDMSGVSLNGINLTAFAFTQSLGEFGKHSLGIVIFLFSFSTMIGMANYNKKCWDYLFKGRWNLGDKTFVLFYGLSLGVGAVIKMGAVVNIIDICYALMAIPNIVATVFLANKVKKALKKYNSKFNV
ncbi:MAG: sodium/alanine symporter [Halobacteriovoraceae bacterium]|nr:sodium/alanine symporter [Halobacteriovoraceae bacterium]|tara:strand:+ start:17668 stop:19023 length:1356 start_codon:yes stop_codon:yes gene_type:complete